VEFSNEVFALDWEEKRWKMIQEGSDGDGDNEEGKVMPSRRHFHSALLLNEDAGYRMVVFGGKSNGYHNDIWKYSLGIDRPLSPSFPQHFQCLNFAPPNPQKRGGHVGRSQGVGGKKSSKEIRP